MIRRTLPVLLFGLLLSIHTDAMPAHITVVELENQTNEAIAVEISFVDGLSFRFGNADVTFDSPDWGISQENRITRLVDDSSFIMESGERLMLFDFFSTEFTNGAGPYLIIPQVLKELQVRDGRGRTFEAFPSLEGIRIEVENYSIVETVWRITVGDLQAMRHREDLPETRSCGNGVR